MPILKGRFSANVFQVDAGKLGTPERMAEALTEHAFVLPAQAAWKLASGWVNLETWIESNFEDRNRWLSATIAYFSLRIDTKKVPPSFRQQLDRRVRTWCAENGRVKCPAAVKSELKETLELELLPTVTPKTALVEVALNVGSGRVYIAGKGAKLEAARKLFFQTFGQAPEIVTGLDGLTMGELERLEGASPLHPGEPVSEISEDEGSSELPACYAEVPPLLFFGGDFLLWLWHGFSENTIRTCGEESFAVTGGADERVLLTAGEWTATVRGAQALLDREVFIALAAGRRIQGLALTLIYEDRNYLFDLSHEIDAPLTVKIPTQVKTGDVGERMLDRMFCADEAWLLLCALLFDYAKARLRPDFEKTNTMISRWVQDHVDVPAS